MNVLDAPLKEVHRDIDVVTTPDGAPVAMVHANNCSTLLPTEAGRLGCQKFIAAYKEGLEVERKAGELIADHADA